MEIRHYDPQYPLIWVRIPMVYPIPRSFIILMYDGTILFHQHASPVKSPKQRYATLILGRRSVDSYASNDVTE